MNDTGFCRFVDSGFGPIQYFDGILTRIVPGRRSNHFGDILNFRFGAFISQASDLILSGAL